MVVPLHVVAALHDVECSDRPGVVVMLARLWIVAGCVDLPVVRPAAGSPVPVRWTAVPTGMRVAGEEVDDVDLVLVRERAVLAERLAGRDLDPHGAQVCQRRRDPEGDVAEVA